LHRQKRIWETVKGKITNPRAKTVIRGDQLTIIPDDAKTLEVISKLPKVKVSGPRQPRVIVYDVDADLSTEDIAAGLLIQNPELELTKADVASMVIKYKLGNRTGSTTHWVIEVPADILRKLENKSIFLGLTRCRVKLHQNIPQCFKCQGFGHTALKCNQELPT